MPKISTKRLILGQHEFLFYFNQQIAETNLIILNCTMGIMGTEYGNLRIAEDCGLI